MLKQQTKPNEWLALELGTQENTLKLPNGRAPKLLSL